MSQLHGGRIVAKALKNEGVSHVFTLCGGHVMSIYDGCLDAGIRVVDTRHEQTAAHAADGWARVTGEPGVAIVTAGPGVTDAVTGAASAWRANIPMLIIGGQGPRSLQDMGSLQDMNHVDLMRPITKWSHAVPEARRLGEYVSMAFRIATTGVPGPVFLEMPVDFLFDSYNEDQLVFPTGARTAAGAYPDPAYIDKAIALLAKAAKPVALVGSQLFWSKRRDAYLPFIEQFGLPVYVNGQARGSLPPDHPNFFAKTRKEALRGADVILIFGTPLDFRLGYGRASHMNPEAKLIQIDLDGGEIGRNRHVDVGIPADTGMAMAALAAAATGMARGGSPAVREWVKSLRMKEEERVEQMRAEMESETSPINPLRLCKEIDGVLDDDTIVIGDGGDFVATAASVLRIAKIGQWLDPGPLGTLGIGPGYAMAAKLARPRSNVIIVYGDGAFGLNGLEYEAFVRQKINVVGVIGNDAAWTQIRRGQVELYGEERAIATKLDFTHYEKVAAAVGAHGEYVERPQDIRPALDRALGCGKPALVNVRLGISEFRKGALSI